MKPYPLIIALLAALCAPAWAINKCTGPDGKVAFQDAPCIGKGEQLALIEAVDEFFERVIQQLDEASVAEKNALSDLCSVYTQCIGGNARTTKTDVLIVHAFKEKLPDDLGFKLREFLKTYPSVTTMIKNKQDRKVLFRSPSILLTYFMVQNYPEQTKEIWPLTPEDIRPIYTDLNKRQ